MRRVATVYYKFAAGHELGLIRGEIDNPPRDIIWLADMADGMKAVQLLAEFLLGAK